MNLLLLSIRHMTKVLMLTLLFASLMTPAMAMTQAMAMGPGMGMSLAMEYERNADFTRRTPVSEAELDRMRGGFQSDPAGPIMSFGIERSVVINGELVRSTVLDIPNLMQFDGNPSATFTHIQTGGGNALPPDMASLQTFMTAIQNSLDNQTIQSQTIINATVPALTWAQSLALGNALSQANIDAIRH
jgi:hypothetical protein